MNKLIIVVGYSLILAACTNAKDTLTATEQNLCDINLNKIANYSAQYSMTTGEPEDSELKTLHAKALSYKELGDIKNCIAVSEQALTIIAQHSNN